MCTHWLNNSCCNYQSCVMNVIINVIMQLCSVSLSISAPSSLADMLSRSSLPLPPSLLLLLSWIAWPEGLQNLSLSWIGWPEASLLSWIGWPEASLFLSLEIENLLESTLGDPDPQVREALLRQESFLLRCLLLEIPLREFRSDAESMIIRYTPRGAVFALHRVIAHHIKSASTSSLPFQMKSCFGSRYSIVVYETWSSKRKSPRGDLKRCCYSPSCASPLSSSFLTSTSCCICICMCISLSLSLSIYIYIYI